MFVLTFLVLQEKCLIRKLRLIPKFIMSQTGKQIITMYVLPNISRGTGNQTMKFSQLIEYNMRNIFLEQSYIKCDQETLPRPFRKKSKLSISLDEKFYAFCFYYMSKLRFIKIYWNYWADHLLLPRIKFFK